MVTPGHGEYSRRPARPQTGRAFFAFYTFTNWNEVCAPTDVEALEDLAAQLGDARSTERLVVNTNA